MYRSRNIPEQPIYKHDKINSPDQVPESHVPILAHVKSDRCVNLSGCNYLPCYSFENPHHTCFFMSWDITANEVSDYEPENRGSIPGQLKEIVNIISEKGLVPNLPPLQ
jgi:hypothetical protein